MRWGVTLVDVRVVLQGEQATAGILPDLHHLKVTGVIAAGLSRLDDVPVHHIHISKGAAVMKSLRALAVKYPLNVTMYSRKDKRTKVIAKSHRTTALELYSVLQMRR